MIVTDKIHQLQIEFEIPVNPDTKISRFVNVILVFGDKITLIDTGVKGSEAAIFEYIQQHNRKYTDIDRVILSHSHPDHVGSAARIKELTGCQVMCHKLEKPWIETSSEYKLQENMTFQVDTFVRDKEFGLRWETGAVIKKGGIELLSDKIKGIVEL